MHMNNMRTGKWYRVTNLGEVSEFQVMEILGNDDFVLKDSLTLETYHMKDLTRYGRGEDFAIEEL